MNNDYTHDETLPNENISFDSTSQFIGKQLGDYKIIREIGHGGMAVVFEAHQLSLDRKVALKIIPQSLIEEPEYLERFKREASAAARLSHPNIVSIHGFGQSGNVYYYIMALASGQSLDEIMQDKKKSLLKSARIYNTSKALEIIKQAASALSYAHNQGVVHRDIKPSNIMIEPDIGRVLITDFGLAKSTHWEKITSQASLFGSPSYMSPRQASGKELDHRTDIYSLGTVLYEMLTGAPPYHGDNALEVIDKVKQEPLPLPASINPAIPPAVSSIIIKAMSKDIWLRYQKMEELISDIDKYQHGEKVSSFIRIAQKKTDRSKPLVLKTLLIIAYLLVSGGLLLGAIKLISFSRSKRHDKYIRQQLELAHNYLNSGMAKSALEVYQQIVKKYPHNTLTSQAREHISKLTRKSQRSSPKRLLR